MSFESDDAGEKQVRRVPLLDDEQTPAETLDQAQKGLAGLKTDRNRGSLPVLHRTLRVKDTATTYLDFMTTGDGQKKATSMAKEEEALNKWANHMGAEERLTGGKAGSAKRRAKGATRANVPHEDGSELVPPRAVGIHRAAVEFFSSARPLAGKGKAVMHRPKMLRLWSRSGSLHTWKKRHTPPTSFTSSARNCFFHR